MKIDLFHNKIISDTITPEFRESFNSNLVPKLAEKYGNSILEIQMYEDYLNSGFVLDGEFYYPLTLVFAEGAVTEWIKWNVTGKRQFENHIPYAYIGNGQIDFIIAENVPEEFKEKISGKRIYFSADLSAPFSIKTSAVDKTFLAGKYSQSFVDAMAAMITKCIEKSFSVSGSEKGGYELVLVFAPETYMEHVVENVTYRRLLITARGCSAKDLWIKWTNLKGNTPLSVSDTVNEDEISFDIALTVPQKVREKEYRFLVRASADKYQYAMGRKNITEWRDLIKRVIKRGELIPCVVSEEKEQPKVTEFSEVKQPAVDSITKEINTKNPFDCIDVQKAPEDANAPEDDMAAKLEEALVASAALNQTSYESDNSNSDLEALLRDAIGMSLPEKEPELEEAPFEVAKLADEISEEIEKIEERIASEDSKALLEEELRRKIEAEMREKIELEAKKKIEEENLSLIAEREKLKAENERLAKLALEMENERIKKETERREEAERLRREIEARERAEQREKERLAEAARLAIIEEQRLASVRAEQEAKLLEEQRRAEEERLLREKEAEEERRRREAEALEAAAKAEATPEPVYVSKNARLLFRRPVDPNVTKRIHEIILTTIKYLHKEDVYIKIKATVPDATTVNLHFVKIPENETELLINIIKVLGKSDLGITKVFLE